MKIKKILKQRPKRRPEGRGRYLSGAVVLESRKLQATAESIKGKTKEDNKMRRKFSSKVSYYFLLYREGGRRSLFCSSSFSTKVSHYHDLAPPASRFLCLKTLCNTLKSDSPSVPTSILSSSVPQRCFSSSLSQLNSAEIPPSCKLFSFDFL